MLLAAAAAISFVGCRPSGYSTMAMTTIEDLVASSQLHWSDYLVLILYFVIVIGVGIWVGLYALMLLSIHSLSLIASKVLIQAFSLWHNLHNKIICCNFNGN